MARAARPAARSSQSTRAATGPTQTSAEPSQIAAQPSRLDSKASPAAAKASRLDTKASEAAAKASRLDTKASEAAAKASRLDTKSSEAAAKASRLDTKASEAALEPAKAADAPARPAAISSPVDKRPRPAARRPAQRAIVEPPGTPHEHAIDAEVLTSHDEITPASPEATEVAWEADAAPPSPPIEVAETMEDTSRAGDTRTAEDEPTEPDAASEFDYAAAPSRFDGRQPLPEADDLGLPEARIDALLDEAARAADDPASRMRMAEAFSEIAQQLGGAVAVAPDDEAGLFASAKELLSPEYYVRQWGRIAMRNRSEDVDDFGLDPAYQERARPWLDALHRRWFRTEVRGLEHVPATGRALLVANHAGALPWDGLMLQTAIRLEHPAHREMRWLTEDFIAHSPFFGALTNRLGAVRACPENAERLLAQEKLVAVFPEGEKGLGKPWAKRYEIQRFGRGGFVKLALRTRTPILPVGIVGSEEAHPLLFRMDRLARLFGMPFIPITPTFPWLGPLGLVPLPSRWLIRFGPPIDLSDEPPSVEHDPVRVQHLGDEVRSAVQALVKRCLEERPRPF
ncbi:MAG: hypothetical protein OHK0013_26520 [Sandaracinaceae bacterium]